MMLKLLKTMLMLILFNSRRGLDLDDDEFNTLDSIIKNGVDNNKSIYQIKIENNEIKKRKIINTRKLQ